MQIEVIKPHELDAPLLAAWSRIVERTSALDIPYFRPEFVQLVGRVRKDVEVAVMRDSTGPIGFFPFQRSQRVGRPVAGRLSDFQAVLAGEEVEYEPRELIAACGLSVWDFDHLHPSQSNFTKYVRLTDGSPFIDLSQGFAHYRQIRKTLGDSEMKQTERKARKLNRDLGRLRLETHTTRPDVLRSAIEWKSQQYNRTNITDVLSYGWVRELLEQLIFESHTQFRGALTALYAGDRLVACHLGMQSRDVLHYWFPTYDVELSSYSPGRVMMLEMCRQADEYGIDRIDLGRGVSTFKQRCMTGMIQVGVGSVDRRPVGRAMRAGWRCAREWVKQTPLRGPVKAPARLLYRVREWMDFK